MQKGAFSDETLILASTSPRRMDLFRTLGRSFEAVDPETEEQERELCPLLSPYCNAFKKAGTVSRRHPGSFVVGADTVIEFDGGIIGKPSGSAAAAEYLRMFSGRSHCVVTAVCILRMEGSYELLFGERSTVFFKVLSEDTIRGYLECVDPLDKAGAYAIQENGDMIIERIEGSFHNITGLPVEKLAKAFRSLGVN